MSDIQSRQLVCGTPLLVEKMSGVNSAAICWMLPAGTAHDQILGESPMWSELILRGGGTLNSRAQADAFDKLGVSRSTDLGTFTLRIAATLLGSNVLASLPLLADMVLRPRMDEDAIEPCRDLCLQAIASLKDDPQERAAYLARERHLPPPLNRTDMGTEDGLRALSRDRLITAYHERVRPVGSLITVAGAVDADPIEELLNVLLEGWNGSTQEPRPTAEAPRGYYHEQEETNQVQIVLMHDAPAEPHQDSILEKVVLNVLSGGMAGRLFSEVREKRGLCYSVNAGYRGDRDYGYVSAYVGTTPDKAQEAVTVLLGELRRITTPEGRVTPEEFHRALVGMKSGVVFSGESSGARAVSLASDQRTLGRPRTLEEITQKLEGVTLDQVNSYLATRRLGKMTVQTLGPRNLKVEGV
jgi:predicted Zn-dependent peptidase